MPIKNKIQQGVTLIEAMIALLVISVGLLGIAIIASIRFYIAGVTDRGSVDSHRYRNGDTVDEDF